MDKAGGCEMTDTRLCLEHAGSQQWHLEASLLEQQDMRAKMDNNFRTTQNQNQLEHRAPARLQAPLATYKVLKQSKFIHISKHMQPAAEQTKRHRWLFGAVLLSQPALETASPTSQPPQLGKLFPLVLGLLGEPVTSNLSPC